MSREDEIIEDAHWWLVDLWLAGNLDIADPRVIFAEGD